jgi:hypothetical protein
VLRILAGFRWYWSGISVLSSAPTRPSEPQLRPADLVPLGPTCWPHGEALDHSSRPEAEGREDLAGDVSGPTARWRLQRKVPSTSSNATTRRWHVVRTKAVERVCGERPVLQTEQGLVSIVHPLDPIDRGLRTGIETEHGPALPFDCFNFDCRPGKVFRRLSD